MNINAYNAYFSLNAYKYVKIHIFYIIYIFLNNYLQMPKMKSETHNKLRKYIKEFGNNIFQTDGKVFICKVFNKDVVFERKSQVQQHIRTETHQ